MSALLCLPQELTHFTYNDIGSLSYRFEPLPNIQPALNCVRETLTILSITCCKIVGLIQEHPLLNLYTFARLKKVALPIELLLGYHTRNQDRLERLLPNRLTTFYPRLAPCTGSRWDKAALIVTLKQLLLSKNAKTIPEIASVGIADGDASALLHDLAQIKSVTLEPDLGPQTSPFI